jgi:vacuolar-type H+-ATPase subunit H
VTPEQEPTRREFAGAPEDGDGEAAVPESAEHPVSIVDLLPDRTDSRGNLSQLLGEHAELEQVLASEPVSPLARAIIGRLIEQQGAEREAFLSALRVYKEETSRLTLDVAQARADLSGQVEAARVEREHLIAEFLDRVDQLSAKISTSSARYTAQLEEKDILWKDAEKRAEVYAGHAANAQSIIADMRRSSSWRLTAPIRLLSKMLARRSSATVTQPDD